MDEHNAKPEDTFDLQLKLRVRRGKAIPWAMIVASLILSTPKLVELLRRLWTGVG
ncbi:MAG: hypothetical protein WCZ18_09010 [Ottowia sp.]